jgi:catechol 2,3-dioxygenase-like lactoylglutathione lyase family enzyme
MTTPKLERLDHLNLSARDPNATCEFYRRVLGMEVETFGKGRLALKLGRQKINVEPVMPKAEPAPFAPAHFCFVTSAPLADWIAHLETCGVALRDGPVTRTGAEGSIESIYFLDPDENSIEVSVYPARS